MPMRRVSVGICAFAVLFVASCGGQQPSGPSPDAADPKPKRKPPQVAKGDTKGSQRLPDAAVPPVVPGQGSPKVALGKDFFPDPLVTEKDNPFGGRESADEFPPIGSPDGKKSDTKTSDSTKPYQGQPPPPPKKDDQPPAEKPLQRPPELPKIKGGKKANEVSSVLFGKTIDEWMLDIPSKDRSRSVRALQAVVLFGPEVNQPAAPIIIRELAKHTSSYFVDASVRVNCCIALGEILAEENKPDRKVVKAAVYVLTQRLRDDQVVVKYHAARALAKIGPDAASAAEQLMTTIREGSSCELRQAAAVALGRIARDEKNGADLKVLNALYTSLRVDPAYQVRLAAIQALTWAGPPANSANYGNMIAKLSEVAEEDPEPTVKIWSHMALMSLDGKVSSERLKRISEMLTHRDVEVRMQSAKALWAVGLQARSEMAPLIKALDDPEKGVVFWAVLALGRLGRHPDAALPRLHKIVADEDNPPELRQAAQETILSIQGKSTKNDDK